jgi:hypothetical protein
MSEEGGGFGITAAEKFFGLILIVMGITTTYYTFTSTSALSYYVGFFGFLSIFLIVLGVFMIIAKTE